MKKSILTKITYTYCVLVVIALTIYAFNVSGPPDWTVNMEEQKHNLLLFFSLILIGFILISIELASSNEKGEKVKKSAI